MKHNRFIKSGLLVLGLALSSVYASAQLTHVSSDPSHVWTQNVRSNGADVSFFQNFAKNPDFTFTESFTVNALPGVTFVYSGAPSIDVGFNGTFDVKVELAYITKESVDNNSLFSVGVGGQVLYSSYGPSSTASWTISGPADSLTPFSLSHTDHDYGVTGTWSNTELFSIWSGSDGTYTYYVGWVDDRSNVIPGSDRDYDDLTVIWRVNDIQIGIGDGAVPEPSTYGLMGAAALLGLVGYRRFKQKSLAKA